MKNILTVLSSLMINLRALILGGIVMISGCTYDMDLFGGDTSPLVISGGISNEVTEHVVNILRYPGYNTRPNFTELSTSQVKIVDDLGNEEPLTFKSYGDFVTSEDFAGVIGRSYHIEIILPDGTEYYTNPQLLAEPTSIDSLYYEIKDTDIHFYVDYGDNAAEKNYYQWRYRGTYQRRAPRALKPSGSIPNGGWGVCYTNEVWYNQIEYCWLTDYDNEYLKISNDINYNGVGANEMDVYQIPVDDKLNYGYMGQVKQYSISEDYYNYLASLENQLNNTGSIFETANYQIVGNLLSRQNPDEVVLGYFDVSAVSSQRIYIDQWEHYFGDRECVTNDAGCLPQTCVSCVAYGYNATGEQPDYWPDSKVWDN